MSETVEVRVREVTRYIVTKYVSDTDDERSGAVVQVGEYDNANAAYDVGYAIAMCDHSRLGYEPGDERIKYPRHPNDPSV